VLLLMTFNPRGQADCGVDGVAHEQLIIARVGRTGCWEWAESRSWLRNHSLPFSSPLVTQRLRASGAGLQRHIATGCKP